MNDRSPIKSILVINQSREEVEPALLAIVEDVGVTFATEPDQVLPALEKAQPEAIFSMSQSTFPGSAQREAIDFPSVRWFHVAGSGYEYIQPWDGERVTVTNGQGVLAPFLAEMVLGAMLMLNGNFPSYGEQQRKRIWQRQFFKPIEGQTLLIVGAGAIGSLVAAKAKSQGMRVIATRRTPQPDPNIDEVYSDAELPRLLAEADFVSLHVRLTDQTKHLFNQQTFDRMKPGAFLINTSRGPVVDEEALLSALQRGQVGGAYLDVFEVEPLPKESPLWETPNVILTPHASDNIIDWTHRCTDLFVQNLRRWNDGQELINLVQS
jgi:phosphoglycerate dehydrogenase-like enzyme